ncbi:MAG: hypothetical protein P4L84_24625, partial [Isosphaeraceae bacterium]|nr:hypothetical protein [Isosphaeraceae bacterium]
APAFADAARARSDRRQAVTRAEEFRDRALADAKGQSREIADRAAGRFEQDVQAARGEADRFGKVLAAAKKAPQATRQRLYLETLATLLPRFGRKVIVAPGQEVDVSLFEGKRGLTAENAENAERKPEKEKPDMGAAR